MSGTGEDPDGADVVVVGAGLAGLTLVRQLRRDGFTGSVMVLGDEPHAPYDRPPLSKELLAGKVSEHEVGLLGPTEGDDLGVDVRPEIVAAALDPASRQVVLTGGGRVGYQHCVLATGSRARELRDRPDLAGVLTLRSLSDAVRLRTALAAAEHLVVIGAGFIGLEVAAGAIGRGLTVTVVEQQPLPLSRVLGPAAGAVVRDLHVSHGVDLRCGAGLAEIVESPVAPGCVGSVRLTDGTTVPADVVLLGVGAIPNVEWLDGSGLLIDDGVLCDAGGRTSIPGVWAAGDVARWPNEATGLHQRVEQWQSALEQAIIVAHNIADPVADARWQSVPYFWSDQYDVKIQFCGHPGQESRTFESPGGPVVGFGTAGVLTGMLAIGQPRLIARGRRLVASHSSWADLHALVGGASI